MTLKEAVGILENHNKWRRYTGDETNVAMSNPTELGIAIDVVIRAAKEHDTAMMVLNQIAEKPRKTKEQRLAKSCVMFLDNMK